MSIFQKSLNWYCDSCDNFEKRLMDRLNELNQRKSYYIQAIVWSLLICSILFLPYITSSFFDYITIIEPEYCDHEIGVIKSYFDCFYLQYMQGMKSGSFIFIPISLCGGVFIEYMTIKDLKSGEALIIGFFLFLIMVVIGTYACIGMKNQISNSTILRVNSEIVESMYTITLFVSIVYSIGVKSIIIDFRENH